MIDREMTFSSFFKRFRLKSGFATLSDFGDALAEKGFVFENSLFSHWQKANRIPKNRSLLIIIIKIFIEKGGIESIKEANSFLESTGQGYLTESEIEDISELKRVFGKLGSAKRIVNFFNTTNKSKKILRSGWMREKIKNPESVAEHSSQMTIIAMILADKLRVDKDKLLKMTMLHDIGEVITQDLVWSRGKSINIEKRSKKERLEKKGIYKIFKTIGKVDEYIKIYREMTERISPESIIFWQLDKLELALQALEYEKEQNKRLDEFFINADNAIRTPFLKKILKEILKKRSSKVYQEKRRQINFSKK